jgi:hypothetical protein
MTRPPPKTALERLQDAGELTLVASAWCAPEGGRKNEWYQVLAVALVRRRWPSVTSDTGLMPDRGLSWSRGSCTRGCLVRRRRWTPSS